MVINKKINNEHHSFCRQGFIYCLFIIGALFSTVVTAANITVTTSRNPVSLDDSFHLIYEANSSVDGDPDFTPVYKNFDVLSSGQSTNMRSVNGSWDLKKTWNLTVIAKNIGQFTIPPIQFGRDISPAIRITIINSSSSNSVSPKGQANIPAKIFLETDIDKKSGWVQSQFVYTVRLLRTVSIVGATLSEPTTTDTDAITQLLSEDSYQTTRGSIRYNVFERRYAIFPQKSGVIKINPIIFDGRINATQARSIFDQFRMSGQQKRLRTEAINITVRPAPETVNLQDWLPASDLQLIEEWSDDISNLKAGEPVTRTIMIAAEGLTGIQLPDLPFEDIKGIKQYPDKAIFEDKKSTTGITGYKQIKIALIPTAKGNYTLPEIKLQWWNTRTNKKQVASLPATLIQVSGSVITAAPPASIQTNDTEASSDPSAMINKISESTITTENNAPYWKWLTLFFALLWLLTLILYFKKSAGGKTPNKTDTLHALPSAKTVIFNVQKNAKNNHAKNTKIALIEWAQIIYNNKNITNLSQVGEHCSSQLNLHIRQLNETLYSTEGKNWDGAALLEVFKGEKILNKNNQPPATLKPLYKQ